MEKPKESKNLHKTSLSLMKILECDECHFTRKSTKYCENCQRVVCDQCALFPICQHCFSLEKVFNSQEEKEEIKFIRLTKNRKIDEISDIIIEDLLQNDSLELNSDIPNLLKNFKNIEKNNKVENILELEGKSKEKMEDLEKIIKEIKEGDEPQKKIYIPGIVKFDERELSTKTLMEICSFEKNLRIFFDKDHKNVKIKYIFKENKNNFLFKDEKKRSRTIDKMTDIEILEENKLIKGVKKGINEENKEDFKENKFEDFNQNDSSKDIILVQDIPLTLKLEYGVIKTNQITKEISINSKKVVKEKFSLKQKFQKNRRKGDITTTIVDIKTQDFHPSNITSFLTSFFNQKNSKNETEELYIKTELEIFFKHSENRKKKLYDIFLKKVKEIKDSAAESFRDLEDIINENSGIVEGIKERQLKIENLERKINKNKKSDLKLISIEDRMNELYFLIFLGIWLVFVSIFNPVLII